MKQEAMLFEVLKDRIGVNMLKILYDNEYVMKTSHTMQLYRLNAALSNTVTLSNILRMESIGLVTAEKIEDTFILSITSKGKKFIEQLTELKQLIEAKPKSTTTRKYFTVEYEISEIGKKILLNCQKIQEKGQKATLKKLTNKLFPKEKTKKVSYVSKQLKEVEELKLIEKNEKNKTIEIVLTDSGKRVVKNQIIV